jgi:hypothetical protein
MGSAMDLKTIMKSQNELYQKIKADKEKHDLDAAMALIKKHTGAQKANKPASPSQGQTE